MDRPTKAEFLFKYKPQIGDIVACWGADFSSRFISGVTARLWAPSGLRFGPSHVALIAPDFEFQTCLWYESTTKCPRPCLAARRLVSGVQVHPIEARVGDYYEAGGYCRVYRPIEPIDIVRTDDERDAIVCNLQAGYLVAMLEEFIRDEIKYDLRGALFSGARVTSRLLSWLGVSREHLFCSDMIATLLMRLGRMPLSDPDLLTPAGLLRYLVNSGRYQELPL